MITSDHIPLAGKVRVQWAEGAGFAPGDYLIQHTIPSTGKRLMLPLTHNGQPDRHHPIWAEPKHFARVERWG